MHLSLSRLLGNVQTIVLDMLTRMTEVDAAAAVWRA